jgi:hypothetical protein
VGRARGTDRTHELPQQASAAPTAHHEQLGVPAFLHQDLGRGTHFDHCDEVLGTLLAKGPLDGLLHQAAGYGFKFRGGVEVTAGGHAFREIEIGVTQACENLQRSVQRRGQPAGEAQRRGGEFGTVNSNQDVFAFTHGTTFAQNPAPQLGPKGTKVAAVAAACQAVRRSTAAPVNRSRDRSSSAWSAFVQG